MEEPVMNVTKITFTLPQINEILQYLGEIPFKYSESLIGFIKEETRLQLLEKNDVNS